MALVSVWFCDVLLNSDKGPDGSMPFLDTLVMPEPD